MAINTYSVKEDKESINKIICNFFYTHCVRLIKNYKNLNHFYLESEVTLTTKHMKHTIPCEKLYIANFDENICEIIKNAFPNINIYNNYSTNFLSSCMIKFGSFWLDYCITMYGNDKFKPMCDVKLILDRKLIINGGIIGLTFSLRNSNPSKKSKRFKTSGIKSYKLSPKEIKMGKFICHGVFPEDTNINEQMNNFIETLKKEYVNIYSFEIVKYYKYIHIKNSVSKMYTFFLKVFDSTLLI